jgi:cholest-4-en-3-one 26-monooxygenase
VLAVVCGALFLEGIDIAMLNVAVPVIREDFGASEAQVQLFSYFTELAAQREAEPGDDVVTKLVQSRPDGEMMAPDQFGFFVTLLVVAGNETTRNAITLGMNALLDHPDQLAYFKRERPESAVDEILRWATPVAAFQRTALNDVEVGDQLVRRGERVGLFYGSANFDEDVFDDPTRFDILRSPNPHLSFGGHGAHFCLGANLARLEVGIMLNTLADLVPDIAKTGEPRRQPHGWINGVAELPVTYR